MHFYGSLKSFMLDIGAGC